jgi:hypothetical protein
MVFQISAHFMSFGSEFKHSLSRIWDVRSLGGYILTLASFGGMLAWPTNAGAQTSAATHLGNVSGWKGMVSVSGNGSGTFDTGSCTDDYSNNQLIDLSPELQGSFPEWAGPSFANNVSVVISDTAICPKTPPCLSTITGLGGVAPTDVFIINIDAQNGTYTLIDAGHFTNTIFKGCNEPPKNQLFPWGPVTGPAGGDIPLVTASYPLPAHGVTLQMTVPPFEDTGSALVVPWNISWVFKPTCRVNIPHTWGQGDLPWGPRPYDQQPGQSISSKGCALTSLAMALAYAGVTTLPDGNALNPLTLNNFLNSSPELTQLVNSWEQSHGFGGVETGMTVTGFTQTHGMNWDTDTRYATDFGKLKFNTFGPIKDSTSNPDGAHQLLDEALCGASPHPVIVAVTGSNGTYPGHFVLVTGRDGDSYTIADPATGTMRTLDDYNDKFQTRGSIVDPTGDISSLIFLSDNNTSLLITDENKNRTGLDPLSGTVLQQIPGSAYFVDRITDGDAPGQTEPESHIANIFQPAQGNYLVVVTGLRQGPFTLNINAFSQDGGPELPVVVTGMAEPGATFTYHVTYNPAPGSPLTVIPMVGDRNGDGVVNCADIDIVKASFGKSIGQPGFDPRADVNADGVVNIFDLSTVAKELPVGSACK